MSRLKHKSSLEDLEKGMATLRFDTDRNRHTAKQPPQAAAAVNLQRLREDALRKRATQPTTAQAPKLRLSPSLEALEKSMAPSPPSAENLNRPYKSYKSVSSFDLNPKASPFVLDPAPVERRSAGYLKYLNAANTAVKPVRQPTTPMPGKKGFTGQPANQAAATLSNWKSPTSTLSTSTPSTSKSPKPTVDLEALLSKESKQVQEAARKARKRKANTTFDPERLDHIATDTHVDSEAKHKPTSPSAAESYLRAHATQHQLALDHAAAEKYIMPSPLDPQHPYGRTKLQEWQAMTPRQQHELKLAHDMQTDATLRQARHLREVQEYDVAMAERYILRPKFGRSKLQEWMALSAEEQCELRVRMGWGSVVVGKKVGFTTGAGRDEVLGVGRETGAGFEQVAKAMRAQPDATTTAEMEVGVAGEEDWVDVVDELSEDEWTVM